MCVNVCDGDVSLVDDDDDERKQLVRTSAEKKWADHMDSAEAWDFLPRDSGGGVIHPPKKLRFDRPTETRCSVGTFPGRVCATGRSAQAFNGVVGVDGAGAVVWAYHMDGAEAWDFLRATPGRVLLVGKADARTFEADRNGTLARWHANSELREVDFWATRGDATGASSRGFERAPTLRRALDERARLVDFLGSLRRRSEVACTGRNRNYNQASHECRVDRRAPGLPAWTTQYEARRGASAAPRRRQAAARRSGGGDGHASLLPTFDFHHADAVAAPRRRAPRAQRARSAGPAHRPRPAQVSLGASGDLVVSSRTLNTVAAGCFSRVVRYALDAGAGTAAVAWQFEWGAAALARWDAARRASRRSAGRARPARGKYDLAAKLLLPEPLANNGLQNAYRVVPWDRIHAESHDSPL
ncbi:hypothetical protein JL722_2714 [Aureococcus anophagefferens]|nr:hypothetical protein JL722_2714 [Aureococcus anophagefferens]